MDKYRLREVREEYNDRIRDKGGTEITQEKMANKCGASVSTISRMEKGETEPLPNVLIGYADTFSVTVDYLLRRSNANDLKNCTVSHELGLSDRAIETLKFIKNKAAYADYDIAAFVSAFIGSGEATFSFFDDLFNMLSAEYGFSKYNDETKSEKRRYSLKLGQNMTDRTMEYIRYDVQPQLQSVIKRCYETLERNELHPQNQDSRKTGRQE
ncbi:MAG: helix-turn-helix domain-containing protein [Lachnospiraceae bacterium]|nr:helix-turn-helix domain-containing protein [Lachnospiraceae bacterium]